MLSVSSWQSSKIALDITKASPSVLVTARPGKQDAFGSFIPTSSATASLKHVARSKPRRRLPSALWPVSYQFPSESPASSSPPSPIIPSITRTTSEPYVMDAPFTFSPTASTFIPASPSYRERNSNTDMNPILASLERKSKLCTRKVYCATCGRPGSDYPRCGKCHEMWCSRECRLTGGKRHVCSTRTSRSPSPKETCPF